MNTFCTLIRLSEGVHETGSTPLALGKSSVGHPVAVAADSTGVFWIDRGVWALPNGETTPRLLASAVSTLGLLATDAGFVFYVFVDATGGTYQVVRVAKP